MLRIQPRLSARRTALLASVLLALCAGLSACGHKGELVLPQPETPSESRSLVKP